jgi:fumarate hydratase class I
MHTGRDAVHAHLDEARAAGRSARRRALSLRSRREERGRRLEGHRRGPDDQHPREPYQADIIKRYGVRAVIGKGGMGNKTLGALKERRGVPQRIGGAAQFYARTIDASTASR